MKKFDLNPEKADSVEIGLTNVLEYRITPGLYSMTKKPLKTRYQWESPYVRFHGLKAAVGIELMDSGIPIPRDLKTILSIIPANGRLTEKTIGWEANSEGVNHSVFVEHNINLFGKDTEFGFMTYDDKNNLKSYTYDNSPNGHRKQIEAEIYRQLSGMKMSPAEFTHEMLKNASYIESPYSIEEKILKDERRFYKNRNLAMKRLSRVF